MIFNTASPIKHKRSYVAKKRKQKGKHYHGMVTTPYADAGHNLNQSNWKW